LAHRLHRGDDARRAGLAYRKFPGGCPTFSGQRPTKMSYQFSLSSGRRVSASISASSGSSSVGSA